LSGEKPATESRFYTIDTVGGMEERVAILLYERARSMGLDVRSIVVPLNAKGYIIVEVGNPADFYHLIRGVRYIKKRRPVVLSKEEAIKAVKPQVEAPKLKKNQTVEIIGGPFKGMKAVVVEVLESRGEVNLTLVESGFRMMVTIPLEHVRPLKEE